MIFRQRKALNALASELVTTDRFGNTLTRFQEDWAQAEDIFSWPEVPTKATIKMSKPLFGKTVWPVKITTLASLDDWLEYR